MIDARDCSRAFLEAAIESLQARRAAGEPINEAWLAEMVAALPAAPGYSLDHRSDRR